VKSPVVIAKLKSISAALLVAAVVLLAMIYFRVARPSWNSRSLDAPAILLRVKQLKQLVTVRYSIQRVVGITEPRVPLGSESVLIMVQGEVLAGVDLAALTPKDMRVSGDTVLINLPDARILEAFLDEKKTKVWDHQITWWTPWVPVDPDLEHRARLQALEDVRSAALDMGILDEAATNAESAIRDLLAALNFKATFQKHSS
jgi:hypothetical protein